MKKLILFIALSLTLTANSYAQVAGTIGDIVNPSKPINGGLLKSLGTVVVANKGKLGAGGIVLGGIGFGLNELKKNPEIIESHLSSYPEDIPNIVIKLSQYEWGVHYLDQMGIGDHYAQTQLDLEDTKEWKDARLAVEQIAVSVNKEYDNSSCKSPAYRTQVWNDLVGDPGFFKNFSTGMIANGFKINQTGKEHQWAGVSELDVNSYYNLTLWAKKFDDLEHDHVPSHATVGKFLNSKRPPLTPQEFKNLKYNLTAIVVTKQMHSAGRTWRGKNKNFGNDWQDLRTATLKDLTNHFLYAWNNNLNIPQLIESTIILWKRNKALCLYY